MLTIQWTARRYLTLRLPQLRGHSLWLSRRRISCPSQHSKTLNTFTISITGIPDQSCKMLLSTWVPVMASVHCESQSPSHTHSKLMIYQTWNGRLGRGLWL